MTKRPRPVRVPLRPDLPGLTNTHSHIHLKLPSLLSGMGDLKLVKRHGKAQLQKEMADCLVRGITTIRDCVTDDLRHTWTLRDEIEGGGLPGPRILQAVLVGNLGGTWTPKRGLKDRILSWAGGLPYVDYEDAASGVIPFAPDASEQAVRDTVDRAIDERNADVIKLYEQRAAKVTFKPAPLMTEPQLAAAADQARKRGVPCTAHHVSLECFRRIVDIGLSSIVHVPNVDDTSRFTPADAVRTATLDSARAVAMADRIGSIEVGKIADLAVLDRNPLDDPTCLGTPAAAVFKDGRLVVDRMGLAARGS